MKKMFVVPRYNLLHLDRKDLMTFCKSYLPLYIETSLKIFFSKTISYRDLVLSFLTIGHHDLENDLKVKGQGRRLSFKVTVIIKITQKHYILADKI